MKEDYARAGYRRLGPGGPAPQGPGPARITDGGSSPEVNQRGHRTSGKTTAVRNLAYLEQGCQWGSCRTLWRTSTQDPPLVVRIRGPALRAGPLILTNGILAEHHPLDGGSLAVSRASPSRNCDGGMRDVWWRGVAYSRSRNRFLRQLARGGGPRANWRFVAGSRPGCLEGVPTVLQVVASRARKKPPCAVLQVVASRARKKPPCVAGVPHRCQGVPKKPGGRCAGGMSHGASGLPAFGGRVAGRSALRGVR
jgi:hypothetical protein